MSNMVYTFYNSKLEINYAGDIYSVRPVVTLSGDVKIASGNGGQNNPFIFEL